MLKARRNKRPRTLKVRLTPRALGRLERLAEKQNATAEQFAERVLGDLVSMAASAANRPSTRELETNNAPPPGYA